MKSITTMMLSMLLLAVAAPTATAQSRDDRVSAKTYEMNISGMT